MAASREQLDALLDTDISEAIPPQTYGPVLTSSPFIPTKSLLNLRDPGAVPGSKLAPCRIYRSGALQGANEDPEAREWLAASVKRVFDLRKVKEREENPDPEILGVENVWVPSEKTYPDPDVTSFAEEGGRTAWKKQFMAIVDVYRPMFRLVLEHVRDRPQEPILFHCTAGRDRTGVLAGLLQNLAGTPREAVLFDYMLSRVGIEPARKYLEQFAKTNSAAASVDTPGYKEMVSLRPDYFLALEEGLEEKYGGWDGYVTSEDGLGLSGEDLAKIKENLRA